jgi:hypothetical protein
LQMFQHRPEQLLGQAGRRVGDWRARACSWVAVWHHAVPTTTRNAGATRHTRR